MKLLFIVLSLFLYSCKPSTPSIDQKIIGDLPQFEIAKTILLQNIEYIHQCNAKVRKKSPDSLQIYINANAYYFNMYILDSSNADLRKITKYFESGLFENINMSGDSCFSFTIKSERIGLLGDNYFHTLYFQAVPDCFDFNYDKKEEVWVEKEKQLSGKWRYLIEGVNLL